MVLGAYATGLPLVVLAAPGLVTTGGGLGGVRPAPRVFLAGGEGLSPSRVAAGADWFAELSILRSGEYRFFVRGGMLSIDGDAVDHLPIRLDAGAHQFLLHQRRTSGPLRVSVEWAGPGFAREPIPARVFSHDDVLSIDQDGRMLFEDLGCSNCHLSDSPSIQQRPGPVLTGLGSRTTTPWIRHWLEAPQEFRDWATMPQMLSPLERADVAAFLAAQTTGVLDEPRPTGTQEERGRTTFQSIGCAACHGSSLPLAGLGSKTTVGHLQRYLLDPLRFSPAGRMPSFHLSEDEALELAAYLTTSRNESFERPVQGGDPMRGREIVRTTGCLACHRIEGLDSVHQAPPLRSLDETRGCLSEDTPAGAPRYRLEPGHRIALQRFVVGYRADPDVAPAPTFDLPRRLVQLGCNACHEINAEPPTGSLAEPAPTLTDVGDKLRVDWIERAIGAETRVLDWQELRMPSYGSVHSGWLAPALSKASGEDPDGPPPESTEGHDATAGLNMLGVDGARGGLGCIGCHGWDEFPALGENGPNLYTTGRRLRPDWFQRWMRNPARILAGTSMPNYFGGADSADARETISNLWAAFRAAGDLPPPAGLETPEASIGGEEMPVPTEHPVVIRWDMPEATPAAIAVGLPGGVSYCFDAGESRLRYAWLGGFVDMSRTLLAKKNRRTNQTETAAIVGEIFFREGVYPIRVGDKQRIPQRRFRGYRLVDSFPEFHYQVDGVSVYERILPLARGVVRKFRIDQVEQPMWFRPAAAEGVEIRSTLDRFVIPRGRDVAFEVTVVATH